VPGGLRTRIERRSDAIAHGCGRPSSFPASCGGTTPHRRRCVLGARFASNPPSASKLPRRIAPTPKTINRTSGAALARAVRAPRGRVSLTV
jgi:hypothetical protein